MKSRLHAYIGTFRQLEILLAVHRTGSITAASEALHLTQPTVSMQMKKLVDAIGLPLYDQLGRKLVFTEAGEAVVVSAREILQSLENLDMTLSDFKGLKAGTLRLGVVTTSKYFIPHLLGDFCHRYPDIDVEMNVANRRQVLERLDQGLDDFYVFSHPPEDDGVELHGFLPNPLVAIAPEDHPLAAKERIALAEFARYPFLMREPGSGTRHPPHGPRGPPPGPALVGSQTRLGLLALHLGQHEQLARRLRLHHQTSAKKIRKAINKNFLFKNSFSLKIIMASVSVLVLRL